MQRHFAIADLVQDARIALRGLLRAPGLALTIVASVGLGIGAATAIFAIIDAALLRPLPYANPSQLVRLYTDTPPYKFRFSVVDYQALSSQQTTFTKVAAYADRPMTYTDGSSAERGTHGKLAAPARDARDQQIRGIDAGNRPDQADRGERERGDRSEVARQEHLQVHDAPRGLLVLIRRFPQGKEPPRDVVQLRDRRAAPDRVR